MPLKNYRPKEISWLAFNERLLQEADRADVPLIERIKFLGIYSNNLDEFFRVRVAILKRLSELYKGNEFEGVVPDEIILQINHIVRRHSLRFDEIYNKIICELEQRNIFIINEKQLSDEQGIFVKNFFEKNVRPRLMPVIISKGRDLPDLRDDAIYLAIHIKSFEKEKIRYALIEVPTQTLSRFVLLPDENDRKYVILLEDIIRYELKEIFYMFDVSEIDAYTIKITRDAELDIDDDVSESYVKKIVEGLERRKEAHPVRLIHDKEIPKDLLDILLKKLHFSKNYVVIEGGRYHNFKDFMSFPKIGTPDMFYPDLGPIRHKDLPLRQSIFQVIKQKDVLLHFPYHPFFHFIDFLREASIDPKVKEIKITIYRVAKNSSVINALVNAARNGKKVTAIMELQARFDEKANIKWANHLRDEGVKVVYGVAGLKVHAKLCHIIRSEGTGFNSYACIGTGNFNEDSASVFSDHFLLTSNKELTREVSYIFEFFMKNYRIRRFNKLLVAPFFLRSRITKMISDEIKHAKEGKKAYIYIKVNNLVDYAMIQKLVIAKREGVDVRLIVRGMFSLMPEMENPEHSIPSIAMIDRFLEHSRVFIFGCDGKEKVYISSADIMSRNLDRRVEVACPILDPALREEMRAIFDIQWKDNVSARILDNELDNKMRSGEEKHRAQLEIHEFLKR